MRKLYSLLMKETLLALALAFVLLTPASREAKVADGLSPESPRKNSFMAGDYLAARFAQRNQYPTAAAQYYISALSGNADNRDLLRRTFTLLAFSGDFERASHLAQRRVEIAKPGETLAFARIVASLKPLHDGDFNTARALLDPKTAYTPQNLSEGALKPVLSWCDVADAKPKQQPEAMLVAATAEEKPSVFARYEQALMHAANGDRGQALASLSTLDFTGQPHRMVDKAIKFYRQFGEEKRAEELLASYRASEPEYRYQEPAATTREQQARSGIAEVFFEVAARATRGKATDDAAVFLRMALYLDPAFDDARLLLAYTLEQMKMHEQALEAYRAIPETSRFRWQAELASASTLNRLGRTEEAKALLASLAARKPQDRDALLLLGDILLSSNQFGEAAEVYSQALERIGGGTAEDWPVFYARGICYEQAGTWDKAEPDFLKALELSPDQPSVLNYLGYSWLMLNKNVERAEEMLRVAVAKEPTDAHILDSYGWALYKLGLYEEALIFLERATMLMPEDPTANDHLGDSYWRLGRTTEAKYQWKKALAFDPPAKDRAGIQLKLENGLAPVTPIALAE